MKRSDESTYSWLHRLNPDPYSLAVNAALLELVPPGLRLLHYTRTTVPAEHLGAFAFYHRKIGPFHLDGIPEPMQREMMFVIWRIIELGGRVPCAPMGLLMRELAETTQRLKTAGLPFQSLTDRTPAQWKAELSRTWVKRTHAFPNPQTFRTYVSPLDRACKILWFTYDTSPWWQREVWDLTMDPRIPRRTQEPSGQKAIHWHTMEPAWLRHGGMYFVKSMMESSQLAWSTAHGAKNALVQFARFAMARGLTSPRLVQDDRQLRGLMMEFLTELRSTPNYGIRNRDKPRSPASIGQITSTVRAFYAFMHDYGDEAAAALDDDRWDGLSPEYLRFWRPGDIGSSKKEHFDESYLYSDADLAKIKAAAPLLGLPRAEGGFGDPQAMRILLLMMTTGRRINEICMLDARPLTLLEDNLAKLRYQQTKIHDAPDTIFVDQEVIELIQEQQAWLHAHLATIGADADPPYLFVSRHNNLRGQNPYLTHVFRTQLTKLVDRAHLTDAAGDPLDLGKTHRFRHTKATSLFNAGVPLHVVQRYMGHTTPEMTMHYAQTLDSTAKTEFLKYKKITSTATESAVDAEDLYDLMLLDTRTDRVLPNGWCTLPPAKTCEKGNACLTCDLFATDERFLDIHKSELVSLDSLIDQRQEIHRERTGEPMSENHVWLTLRRREQQALSTIVKNLETGGSKPAAALPAPATQAREQAGMLGGQGVRTGHRP
ncbi:tyrosine-type recombinase/integrase [Arthrobacter sp. A2-55]|uniref:tyrosine-type recombinase/integrase n=1 Tax=Arthrobacter sp. A2-55 TaxID=2897337 RepID=UPI0021CDDC01|nr:site-specific integrase [Arthrobacter sp. A2-55]MCU6479034.1 site-specific integrase [Arthrobacter sp. A2-55]